MALHSMAQHNTAWQGSVQHGTAWLGTAWHNTLQQSTVWHSTAWHGTARHSMAPESTAWHSESKQPLGRSRCTPGTARHSMAQPGRAASQPVTLHSGDSTAWHSRSGQPPAGRCPQAALTFLAAAVRGLSRTRTSRRQQLRLPMAAAVAVVAVHGARALPALPLRACSAPFIAEGTAAGQRPPMLGLLPRATPVGDGPPATVPD